jgi:hypothetical protein
VLLLVPSDPLAPRRPDPHFAPEAEAARDLGLTVAVVDHDAAVRGDAAGAVGRVPREAGVAAYRGWMLRSSAYAALAGALAARGVRLRTDARQYERAHELPGWIDALAGLTPETAWTTGVTRAAFDAACGELGAGPAVLRDWVKSVKDRWDEAAFVPDVADADGAWRVASRLVALRGDELTGGFALRRFERFASPEVRTWWVDGRPALATAHPDTPDDEPPSGDAGLDALLADVAGRLAPLGLPFVTVDVVRREDGAWRVVELGDGQVSDRPTSCPAPTFTETVLAPNPKLRA